MVINNKIILSFIALILVLQAISATSIPQIVQGGEMVLTKYDSIQAEYFDTNSTMLDSVHQKICFYPKKTISLYYASTLKFLQANFNVSYVDEDTNQTDVALLTNMSLTKSGYTLLTACTIVDLTKIDSLILGPSNGTIIYDKTNDTLYLYNDNTLDFNDFTVQLFVNGQTKSSPVLSWYTQNEALDYDVDFGAIVRDTSNITNVTFRINKFTGEDCNQQGCGTSGIDFTGFEAKNNITNKNITPVYPTFWQGLLDVFPDIFSLKQYLNTPIAYDVYYEGDIIDLDPSFYLLINSATTSDVLFMNMTEASSLGLRNSAPVLSMDFNSAPENTPGLYNSTTGTTQGTYTKDGSIYNNFGTTSGYLSELAWHNQGSKINNSLQFDKNLANYVSLTGVQINGDVNYTVSLWAKPSSTSDPEEHLFSLGNANTYPQLYKTASTAGLTMSVGGVAKVISNVFKNDTWIQIAYTRIANYSGTECNISIYINGSFADSWRYNGSIVNPTFVGRIGSYVSAGYTWNGSIDDVIVWNRALNSTEISTIYNNGLSGLTTDNSTIGNQVAHLRLDELSGTKAVNDMNYSANGTLTNYPTTSVTTPVYNATGGISGSGAYRFDGVNDYIQAGTNPTGVNGLTYSTWIYKSSSNAYRGILTSRPSGTLTGFGLDVSGTQLNFWVNSNSGTGQVWANINNNQWYHVVGVFNPASGYDLYVNGINVSHAGSPTPINLAAATMYIGNDPVDLTRSFNGSIDNVQIFNRALSASEVMSLYNGTLANKSLKYSTQNGNFQSLVFYNSTQTYWNISLATADTQSRSGLVNPDNSINLSNPNLVSYWSLDGNYNDATGRNNGTGVGTLNNATGLTGGATKFDGSTGYINITSLNTLYNQTTFSTTGLTMSIWFTCNDSSGGSRMTLIGGADAASNLGLAAGGIDFLDGTVSNILQAQIWDTSLGAYRQASNPVSLSCTPTSWHHVVGRFGNDGNISLFIDGIKVNSTTYNQSSATVGKPKIFQIGGNVINQNTVYREGQLSDAIIFNSTLTDAQISQLYKSGLSKKANTNITIQTRTANSYNISDPSLVAFWALNNDSSIGENSTLFVDATGRNNGTAGCISLPIVNSTAGLVGNGLDTYHVAGASCCVNVSNSPSINITGNITISAWVNIISSDAVYRYVVSKQLAGTGYQGYALGKSSTGYAFMEIDGNNPNYAQVLGTTNIQNGKWYHILGTYNGSVVNVYVNGILEKSTAYSSGFTSNSNNLLIGSTSYGAANYFNGYIDEVRIYNRSLSASEVLDLYNLGSTHINWDNGGAYTNETLVNDGVSSSTSSGGKFMQMKTNLYSNTTDSSPYISSYNITSTSNPVSELAPNITFNSQTPADATGSNLLVTGLNISYNITDIDTTPVNVSTVQLYYKLNSTTSQINWYINGTLSSGYIPNGIPTNTSSTFLFHLDDHDVYPATYNINPDVAEYAQTLYYNLTSATSYIKFRLLNVTNLTTNNFIEISVRNRTATANPLLLYTCNSTYTTGVVSPNNACYQFASISVTDAPSHTHTGGEVDYFIQYPIINGSIGTIKVTDTMYILARGTNNPTNNWAIGYIANESRPDTSQTTSNNGVAWSNFTSGTFLGHLHQFRNDTGIWYYVCANDTINNQTCSTPRNDVYTFGGLNPIVTITSPLSQTYSKIIDINYSAISPNNYNISNYSIALYDENLTFMFNISNSTTNTTFKWNSTTNGNGQHFIRVYATDNLSQTGSTFSNNFSIDNQVPNVIFQSQSPTDLTATNLFNQSLYINYSISDALSNINTVTMYYKKNRTTTEEVTFLNGTAFNVGWITAGTTSSSVNISNISSNYSFRFMMSSVYPAIYNLRQSQVVLTDHSSQTLVGQNDYFKIRIFNVSNSLPYSYFMLMANTSDTGNLRVYYCNETYTNEDPTNTNLCYNFNSISAKGTYDTYDSGKSAYQVVPISINNNTGMLGTVKVTPTSYFLLRGRPGTNWNIYNVPNVSRTDTIQTTTNNGNAWTNQSYTIDAHLHQFDGDVFWYYVCANDTFGNNNCSDVREDALQFAGLPPTSPSVYSPTNTTLYSFDNMIINYTASVSMNSYPIVSYNISLKLANDGVIYNIIANNSPNLGYIWNIPIFVTNDSYKIAVTACDNLSQCSTGESDVFSIIQRKRIPNLTLVNDYNWSAPVGNTTNTSGLDCPSELTCSLTRNGVLKVNPDIAQLLGGFYNYSWFTLGNENYTEFSVNNTLNMTGSGLADFQCTEGFVYGYISGTWQCRNETIFVPQVCGNDNSSGHWNINAIYLNGSVGCSFIQNNYNQVCPTNYTQTGTYSNGSIICSYLNITTTSTTTTGGVIDLTKGGFEKPYVLLKYGIRF